MKTVYRSKRFSFFHNPHYRRPNHIAGGNKLEVIKRVQELEKQGYECKYPIQKVVNIDNLDEFGRPDESDCFYETEMQLVKSFTN